MEAARPEKTGTDRGLSLQAPQEILEAARPEKIRADHGLSLQAAQEILEAARPEKKETDLQHKQQPTFEAIAVDRKKSGIVLDKTKMILLPIDNVGKNENGLVQPPDKTHKTLPPSPVRWKSTLYWLNKLMMSKPPSERLELFSILLISPMAKTKDLYTKTQAQTGGKSVWFFF